MRRLGIALRDLAMPMHGLADEERAAVEAERVTRNRGRVVVLAGVMAVFHVVFAFHYGLLSGEVVASREEWRTNLTIIHGVGVLANVLALAFRRWRPTADGWMVLYLIYGAVTSANTQLLTQNIDVFISVVVILPFAVRLRPVYWVVGSTCSLVLLLAAASYLQPDAAARLSITNNAVPTVVVTWVLAFLQHGALVRDVVQRRTIERQRDELTTLNDRLDRQLRQLVIDRSRDLGRAIGHVAPAPAELPAGTVLVDRFEIVRQIGKGGMGVVYRANDRLVGRPVALKMIRFGGERSSVQRFLREVEAMSEIDHPAVARSLHVDLTQSGRLFQAQELVSGEPLDAVKRRTGAFELEHAAAIGEVLAAALAAAHERGVIHRDVKPSNVMLTTDEPGLKLLDFGVSKLMASEEEHTQTGVLIGTPAFMAPEQRSASDATPASDVYSLGMTLFAMVTDGEQGAARSTTAKPIVDTIAKCLEPEPLARPTAMALCGELAKLRGSKSLAARNAAVLPAGDATHDTVELR